MYKFYGMYNKCIYKEVYIYMYTNNIYIVEYICMYMDICSYMFIYSYICIYMNNICKNIYYMFLMN